MKISSSFRLGFCNNLGRVELRHNEQRKRWATSGPALRRFSLYTGSSCWTRPSEAMGGVWQERGPFFSEKREAVGHATSHLFLLLLLFYYITRRVGVDSLNWYQLSELSRQIDKPLYIQSSATSFLTSKRSIAQTKKKNLNFFFTL